MRILKQTPTQLIIQHRPLVGWLWFSILAISSLVGAIALPLSSPETGVIACVPGLIGLCIVLILSLPPKSGIASYIFDKENGYLYAEYKGLLGTNTIEYPINIHGIKIDTDFGSPLFGVKVVLSKGSFLHLCPDYSMSEDTAREMVSYISNFLSL